MNNKGGCILIPVDQNTRRVQLSEIEKNNIKNRIDCLYKVINEVSLESIGFHAQYYLNTQVENEVSLFFLDYYKNYKILQINLEILKNFLTLQNQKPQHNNDSTSFANQAVVEAETTHVEKKEQSIDDLKELAVKTEKFLQNYRIQLNVAAMHYLSIHKKLPKITTLKDLNSIHATYYTDLLFALFDNPS